MSRPQQRDVEPLNLSRRDADRLRELRLKEKSDGLDGQEASELAKLESRNAMGAYVPQTIIRSEIDTKGALSMKEGGAEMAQNPNVAVQGTDTFTYYPQNKAITLERPGKKTVIYRTNHPDYKKVIKALREDGFPKFASSGAAATKPDPRLINAEGEGLTYKLDPKTKTIIRTDKNGNEVVAKIENKDFYNRILKEAQDFNPNFGKDKVSAASASTATSAKPKPAATPKAEKKPKDTVGDDDKDTVDDDDNDGKNGKNKVKGPSLGQRFSQMSEPAKLGTIFGGLAIGGSLAESLVHATGPAAKYTKRRVAELEAKVDEGTLGRDPALEAEEFREMTEPVRALAAESQRRQEAAAAGAGESRRPADLARIRDRYQGAITQAIGQAGEAQSRRRAQRAAQEKAELESMYAYQQQSRENRFNKLMSGLTMAAGQVGAMYAAQAKTKPLDPEEVYKKFSKLPYFDTTAREAKVAELIKAGSNDAAQTLKSEIERVQKEQVQMVNNYIKAGSAPQALEALKSKTGAQPMSSFGLYTGNK